MTTPTPTRIGIVVFDDAEELDVAGPYDVLAAWAQIVPGAADVRAVSADGGTIRCAKGLRLVADIARDECGPLDVLVHPGGRGTRRLMRDGAHLDWVRARRADTPLLTSVCTGSLVLAAAGVLAGRPATTHWSALDELRAADPSVRVDEAARFVDDGDVVTSAGVSAGIDMALHLVARLAGVQTARAVRHEIQYDPEPPV